jgi:hypothetical protein
MEIRESDEVGEVGEEAVGPLMLSRPERGVFSTYFTAIAVGTFSGLAGWLKTPARHLAGRDEELAQDATQLLLTCLMILLLLVPRWIRNWRNPLRLLIRRSQNQQVKDQRSFEFWSSPLAPIRWVQFLLGVVIPALGICLLVSGKNFIGQIAGSLFLVFGLYMSFRLWEFIFHPMLRVDAQKLEVGGRSIDWREVQAVEVVHSLESFGGFEATELTFIGQNERKLGHVRLSADVCDMIQENNLLEFIAQILGWKVKPVAFTGPDWI